MGECIKTFCIISYIICICYKELIKTTFSLRRASISKLAKDTTKAILKRAHYVLSKTFAVSDVKLYAFSMHTIEN